MSENAAPKSSSKAKSKATKPAASKAKSTATKKPAAAKTTAAKADTSKANSRIPAPVKDAADRVGSLVSPVFDRVGGNQVTVMRGQVEGILRQVEKRGGTVIANEKLKVVSNRAEKIQTDLTKALEGQSARAQELLGQARGQLSNLRP